MKRDMDLIRKILFEIEDKYISTALINLSIDGFDMQTVAYHCKILHDGGLVSFYKGEYASDELYIFQVGNLTWEGHEFLDTVREDSVWNKTIKTIQEKTLDLSLGTVKMIASAIVTATAEGVTNAILKNGGIT